MAFQDSRSSLGGLLAAVHEIPATTTRQDFDLRGCAVTSSCHWNISIISNRNARRCVKRPQTLTAPYAGAAIDRQRDAGDKARFVGGEKQCGVGDVQACAHL